MGKNHSFIAPCDTHTHHNRCPWVVNCGALGNFPPVVKIGRDRRVGMKTILPKKGHCGQNTLKPSVACCCCCFGFPSPGSGHGCWSVLVQCDIRKVIKFLSSFQTQKHTHTGKRARGSTVCRSLWLSRWAADRAPRMLHTPRAG